ncbi:MAG: GNAT family N-acetyltransferase [Chloroflexi bacterium]|nr:MAG: GNAT family N-acetyltransferase [Chloroflexota bacterium]
MRRDGTDLTTSRVLLVEGVPAGFGLVARRGWISRLAAMGIIESLRGQGAGSYLMGELIREARERGEHGMELEVIAQNAPAIALYQKYGFKKMRRLIGLSLAKPPAGQAAPLVEVDIRSVANLINQIGLPDLPWQLAGETAATFAPPARAYRLDSAYAIITNPDVEHVSFWAILVESQSRRQGQATRLIQSLFARYPAKTWHVPAIFPEETVGPFEKIGFQREEISQWQMSLELS